MTKNDANLKLKDWVQAVEAAVLSSVPVPGVKISAEGEKIFEDASFINADDPLRMPMTYAEVNSNYEVSNDNQFVVCS